MIKITYLDHSGFTVTTPDAVMVFDYYKDPDKSSRKSSVNPRRRRHLLRKSLPPRPLQHLHLRTRTRPQTHLRPLLRHLLQISPRQRTLGSMDEPRRHPRPNTRHKQSPRLQIHRRRRSLRNHPPRRPCHLPRRRPQRLALGRRLHTRRITGRTSPLREKSSTISLRTTPTCTS